MSLQPTPFTSGIIVSSILQAIPTGGATSTILNAAGESVAMIGRVRLQGGSGSKTISSAGGSIINRFGSTTFADAGSNLRIGIQDVAATGLEDGTFDVYADLVGGTDTITTNAMRETTMETGSKTISHGDIVAICIEMTAFGGADSVQAHRASSGPELLTPNFPYTTFDSGAGPARGNSIIPFTIKFDDGTIGWIEQAYFGYDWGNSPSTVSFNSGSATDEYAAVFKLPFKTSINGAALMVGSIASTDNFEIILYSDPYGTPTAQQTVAVAPAQTGSTSALESYMVHFTPTVLEANTYYAIALRPTTANSITFGYYNLTSGYDYLKRPTIFGEDIEMAGRADQTGAFTETQVYDLPLVWLSLDKFDDGSSRIKTHPGMAGGMRG